MTHKQSVYKTALMLHIPLIVLLLCCVALIGCPEGAEMADDVIQPTSSTGKSDPAADPNVDPNADPNVDPNADPNVDPNADPNVDPNADPNVDPNVDPTQ